MTRLNGRHISVNLDQRLIGLSKVTVVGCNFKPSKSTVVEPNFGTSKTTVVERYFGPSKITVVERNFGLSKIAIVDRNFGPSKTTIVDRYFGRPKYCFWTVILTIIYIIFFGRDSSCRTTRSCIIGPYHQGCGPDSIEKDS